MASQDAQEWRGGLERSCRPDLETRIVPAPPQPGIERIEASFTGQFFEPHRHDTYAIGVTLEGIQTFNYRGEKHFSQPGQIIVLHPDEVHDGAAGTDEGLRYRMLYLEPALIREALSDQNAALPFVDEPVIEDERLCRALLSALDGLDCDMEEIEADEVVGEVADGLLRHASPGAGTLQAGLRKRVWRVREYLQENCACNISSQELEEVSGLDRYTLARQFRQTFGTSPHRFLVMRRLERARQLAGHRMPLAEAAVEAGFADQSHFSRHFKKAYGLTPGRWVEAMAPA